MVNQTKFAAALIIIFYCFMNTAAQQNLKDWQTPAEKTEYRTTPDYAETLEYLKRLDAASPWIRLSTFGKTGEGRDLLLVVAAKDDAFTPEKARKQGKAIVLLQACIHAGESDGKDAGLALLRDIAVLKTQSNLLDKVVLVFEPIYNADGHERRSPFNRINQNGPEQMGWRGNGRNINLNRDYMKADEPETQAWLKLWNTWQPDLFVDSHVTDGADYRYNITFQYERHQTAAASVRDWLEDAFQKRIIPATEKNGNLLSPYLSFEDNRELKKGIFEFLSTPRFATGYTILRNRPGVLIESHSLKTHKNRINGTYDFISAILAEVNQNPAALFAANKRADAETLENFKTYDANKQFPLSVKLNGKSMPFALKAVESKIEKSEISGMDWVQFDAAKPLDLIVPFYGETDVAASVAPPLAYILPPQWTEVINRLELHGVKFERTTKAESIAVETYRFTNPKWAGGSFESRVMLREFKTEKTLETRTFPAGSILIRLQQPAAKAAIHLLEPAAPDSLLRWGFFNPIFEQKEYGEPYLVEKIAREMLAKDAKLKAEFEEKLKTDKDFAANPNARLNFFFERSPYFDKNIGLYPVGRILTDGSYQSSANKK